MFWGRKEKKFIPLMKELKEMAYQYDRDYVFNSSKFDNHFNFVPTPYIDGIKNIIQSEFSKREK